MRIILLLLISLFLQAQTLLTETFSDFTFEVEDSTKGLWDFDTTYHSIVTGDSIEADRSGRGNTLTANNWSTGFADESVLGNPLYSGGHFLKFNGTDENFTRPGGSSTDFNPGLADFTIEAWVNVPGISVAGNVIGKGTTLGSALAGWFLYIHSDGSPRFKFGNGVVTVVHEAVQDVDDGNWHYVAAKRDGDDLYIKVDGNNTTSSIGALSSLDVTNGHPLRIGTTSSGNHFADSLSTIRYTSFLRTEKQLKEAWGLAKGWVSNSGGVYNALDFTQGVLSDTIYYNTLLAAGKWRVDVDIYGNSGTETYRILTSSDASTWTTLGSGSASSSATKTTLRVVDGLGYIGLAVSSPTDTVFFDNLTVSMDSDGQFGNKKNKKFKQFRRH